MSNFDRIARLNGLDRDDRRIYVLNWVGLVRRHSTRASRYQVFVRFVEKGGRAHQDVWIPLDQFPFLILGSEWYRGLMVGKPVGARRFTLAYGQAAAWHAPTRVPRPGHICFGRHYFLAMDNPAAPVLELRTRLGETLLLPLSELLRTHYFFLPRALPSLLGGLVVFGNLPDKGLEAWHPSGTRWLDEAGGLAQVHRAKFINDYNAMCLARLLFDAHGRRNLVQLSKWTQQEFIETKLGSRAEHRSSLPQLTLPYATASWQVVTRWIGRNEEGKNRYLVLQMVGFDASEPYRHLKIEADDQWHGESMHGQEGDEAFEWSKWLTPDAPDPLPVEDQSSDGRMTPVSLEHIVPIDHASKRRCPIRETPDRTPKGQQSRSARPVVTPVAEGSVDGPGPGGSERAPIVLGSDDRWPKRNEELDSIAIPILSALQQVVESHRAISVSADYQLLPDDEHAYSYVVPKSDSAQAIGRAYQRQFLVVQVRIGTRFAYVIEPERRITSDSFPLGLWCTRDGRTGLASCLAFSTSEIEAIAKAFETAYRAGRSWLSSEETSHAFAADAVQHPPRVQPTKGALEGFQRRIIQRIMTRIGHADAAPESMRPRR